MTKVIESLLSRPNRCISPWLHCKKVCLQPRLCVRSHCRPQLRANARTDVNQIGATRIIRTRTEAARAKAFEFWIHLFVNAVLSQAPV